jgi:hypothetical protein
MKKIMVFIILVLLGFSTAIAVNAQNTIERYCIQKVRIYYLVTKPTLNSSFTSSTNSSAHISWYIDLNLSVKEVFEHCWFNINSSKISYMSDSDKKYSNRMESLLPGLFDNRILGLFSAVYW